MVVFSASTFGQTKECDCSGPLGSDLKTKINETEYLNFKDWLYSYFEKDETTQNSLKTSATKFWRIFATHQGICTVGRNVPKDKLNNISWKFN